MIRKGAFSLSIAILTLIAAIAITVIWTQVIPQYRAQAEIRVRPVIPRLVFDTDGNGQIPFYDSFVNTQVAIIRSTSVLTRVLDQNDVQKTSWHQEPERSIIARLLDQPPTPSLERLKNSLSVAPRSSTEIIDVAFTDASSQDAVAILDNVVNEYLRYLGQKTGEGNSELFQKLTEEYKSLDNEIKGRELVINNLTQQLGTDTPSDVLSRRRVCLDTIEARLADNRMQIEMLGWKQNEIKADEQTLTSDPNYRSVVLSELLGSACKDHAEGLKIIEIQRVQLEQEKPLLEAEYRKQRDEYDQMWANTQLLKMETERLEYRRALFTAVRRRLDEERLERRAVVSPIELLAPAFVASKPYRDHRVLYTAIALALCGLGITVAYWRCRRPPKLPR